MHLVCKLFKTDKAFESRMYLVYLAVTHFHPLSYARLPMNTRLKSPLHTANVRSIPCQFCQFLERMKTDRAIPEILLVRCVRFVSVGQWDQAFRYRSAIYQ